MVESVGKEFDMVSLLSRIFIKDRQNYTSQPVRRAYGMMCGFIGVFLNIVLFAAKFFAGLISGAISITADAFNNLSDAGSSIITLLGFKIAGQKPDLDHPFGHGRMEYISGLIVSMIIIVFGVDLVESSIDKIINPEHTEFSLVSAIILVSSILVKFYMGIYNRRIGKKIDSSAMRAASSDSFSDCISTGAVLVCTIIAKFTSVDLDAYCGLVVSILVIWAGLRAAIDTITPLLGTSPSEEFVAEVERIVMSYEDVVGIHDLIVHDYGPGRRMLSLHAEVSSDGNIMDMHDTIDNIERKLKEKLMCDAVIHMDPIDVHDKDFLELSSKLKLLVSDIDERLTVHDLRTVSGPTHTNLIFDVVVPYDVKISEKEIKQKISDVVKSLSENYYAVITIDKPY